MTSQNVSSHNAARMDEDSDRATFLDADMSHSSVNIGLNFPLIFAPHHHRHRRFATLLLLCFTLRIQQQQQQPTTNTFHASYEHHNVYSSMKIVQN